MGWRSGQISKRAITDNERNKISRFDYYSLAKRRRGDGGNVYVNNLTFDYPVELEIIRQKGAADYDDGKFAFGQRKQFGSDYVISTKAPHYPHPRRYKGEHHFLHLFKDKHLKEKYRSQGSAFHRSKQQRAHDAIREVLHLMANRSSEALHPDQDNPERQMIFFDDISRQTRQGVSPSVDYLLQKSRFAQSMYNWFTGSRGGDLEGPKPGAVQPAPQPVQGQSEPAWSIGRSARQHARVAGVMGGTSSLTEYDPDTRMPSQTLNRPLHSTRQAIEISRDIHHTMEGATQESSQPNSSILLAAFLAWISLVIAFARIYQGRDPRVGGNDIGGDDDDEPGFPPDDDEPGFPPDFGGGGGGGRRGGNINFLQRLTDGRNRIDQAPATAPNRAAINIGRMVYRTMPAPIRQAFLRGVIRVFEEVGEREGYDVEAGRNEQVIRANLPFIIGSIYLRTRSPGMTPRPPQPRARPRTDTPAETPNAAVQGRRSARLGLSPEEQEQEEEQIQDQQTATPARGETPASSRQDTPTTPPRSGTFSNLSSRFTDEDFARMLWYTSEEIERISPIVQENLVPIPFPALGEDEGGPSGTGVVEGQTGDPTTTTTPSTVQPEPPIPTNPATRVFDDTDPQEEQTSAMQSQVPEGIVAQRRRMFSAETRVPTSRGDYRRQTSDPSTAGQVNTRVVVTRNESESVPDRRSVLEGIAQRREARPEDPEGPQLRRRVRAPSRFCCNGTSELLEFNSQTLDEHAGMTQLSAMFKTVSSVLSQGRQRSDHTNVGQQLLDMFQKNMNNINDNYSNTIINALAEPSKRHLLASQLEMIQHLNHRANIQGQDQILHTYQKVNTQVRQFLENDLAAADENTVTSSLGDHAQKWNRKILMKSYMSGADLYSDVNAGLDLGSYDAFIE